jgi:hypothetical protein
MQAIAFIKEIAWGRKPGSRRARTLAYTVFLLGAAVAGALGSDPAPAFADVTSYSYGIGAMPGSVANVTVTPRVVATGQSTYFQVTFAMNEDLSGSSGAPITLVPSETLFDPPSSVSLADGSCTQSGTNGGTLSDTGLTIDVASSCTLAAETSVTVAFDASGPVNPGRMTFAVSVNAAVLPGTSNPVSVVQQSGPVLSAGTYQSGALTFYTISGVNGLVPTSDSLALTPSAVDGSQTMNFEKAIVLLANGTLDPVTSSSYEDGAFDVTLGDPLGSSPITITVSGTNPPASTSVQEDEVVLSTAPTGLLTTNAITFGGSVSGLTVSPSSTQPGGTATYDVTFRATDALPRNGDVLLTESVGPTNFSTVTAAQVTDSTANWHFVTAPGLSTSGLANLPVRGTVNAGDLITVILAGVTNPSTAGPVGDFAVSTTADPAPANAPPYTIGATAPGVTVTVSPATPGATATYTINELIASSTLTGGVSSVELEAPAGTEFPTTAGDIIVTDLTTLSASGSVSDLPDGGGSNDLTFIVPSTIGSGDVLMVTLIGVVNPSASSTTDAITVTGDLGGQGQTPTTTAPTTTTTRPRPSAPARPLLEDKTTVAKVSDATIELELSCRGSRCTGTITVTHLSAVLGKSGYRITAGKTVAETVRIRNVGLTLLHTAEHHITEVSVTITVAGGQTVREKTKLELVG